MECWQRTLCCTLCKGIWWWNSLFRAEATMWGLFLVHISSLAGSGSNSTNLLLVQSNLSEARAENPYWLFTMFTMAGNVGYLPEDLFEVLGIYARLPIHTKFSLMLLSLVMCRLVCVGRLISLDLELGILLLLIFIICIWVYAMFPLHTNLPLVWLCALLRQCLLLIVGL